MQSRQIPPPLNTAKAFVLAPPNMTVPESGPNGFLGDRVHQIPAVAAISGSNSPTFLWPDDAATRAFFSLPNVRFVSGSTATEAIAALQGESIAEIFCLYSPLKSIPAGREADCKPLREAELIASHFPSAKVHRATRLDPLGAAPVWKQLRQQLGFQNPPPALPWLKPTPIGSEWVSIVLQRSFAGWLDDDSLLILSPFSGSPKKAVRDEWWREFVELLPGHRIVVPVHGQTELQKAHQLFAESHVLETSIEQCISLAALPNARVLGVDGGRLNLLAASSQNPVHAFHGIWPSSAWALPNVQALPLTLGPGQVSKNYHP